MLEAESSHTALILKLLVAAVDKLLPRTAEASAAGLWASCFCCALLSSYGLKLPSCCASSSLRCNGRLPSPHFKLGKLPSILPDASSSEADAGGPSVKAPGQAAVSEFCCARSCSAERKVSPTSLCKFFHACIQNSSAEAAVLGCFEAGSSSSLSSSFLISLAIGVSMPRLSASFL